VTTSAVERSSELSTTVASIWGDACATPAPPTQIFWAFCGQRLGPSVNAWTLYGIVLPDPPGTVRKSPVPNQMQVEQPARSAADGLLLSMGLSLAGLGLYPAQIIGAGPTLQGPAAGRLVCQRALELPELLSLHIKTDIASSFADGGAAALATIKATVLGSRWIRLHTGLSAQISLLLGIDGSFYKGLTAQTSWVVIRERDAAGNLISETNLAAMSPKLIATVADLPAAWGATTSPWFADVESIVPYFTSHGLFAVFLQWKPQPTTAIIEVAVVASNTPNPSVAVGAIASLPASEVSRYQNAVQLQLSTVKSIQNYLDGGTPVPLLAPGTTYTITVNYDVATTEADGTPNSYLGNTQAFQFATDTKPPASLSSYVLCSFPDQGDTFVFYEDPVDVVFNDNSAIQVFSAYGYKLEIDLRAADGLPDVKGAPVTTVAINGVGTASYDTMLQMIASGKLPCVGSAVQYQNQIFNAPVSLRPLMGYTLDINTSPALPPPPAGTAVTPLFRRSFSTGRYANMQALATDLGATLITHRPLNTKLSFAPTGGAPIVTPDQDMQDAFTAAGEQALPAPEKNALVMYWVPSAPNGPYVPYAILIDSVETVWRTRAEPGFQTPIVSDPSFQIVTIGAATSLEVKEQGTANIAGYVRSPGGTRTIAFFIAGFAPPPTGTALTLVLHRPPSSVYGNADESASFFSITVSPQAPWENDHV
jgi:hypothetical protein